MMTSSNSSVTLVLILSAGLIFAPFALAALFGKGWHEKPLTRE